MSRGEFGGGQSYGTLSGSQQQIARGDRGFTTRYQDTGQSQEQFQNLSDSVISNIFQINNNTSALERTLKQLIGGKDGFQEEKLDHYNTTLGYGLLVKALCEQLPKHRIQQATNELAAKTTSMLKQMSSLCFGSTIVARQQRVQHERLKEEFRESISRYYSVQNRVVEKEKLLVGSTRAQMERGYEADFGNESSALVEDDRRRQEQEQLDLQIDIDESLIREREERIRQIEGDILDINEIFRDLATMVYDQGDMVDSIEANVERAHTNVEGANIQLGKASLYQKKARAKMCILLLILVVVAGIVTLIIVLSK